VRILRQMRPQSATTADRACRTHPTRQGQKRNDRRHASRWAPSGVASGCSARRDGTCGVSAAVVRRLGWPGVAGTASEWSHPTRPAGGACGSAQDPAHAIALNLSNDSSNELPRIPVMRSSRSRRRSGGFYAGGLALLSDPLRFLPLCRLLIAPAMAAFSPPPVWGIHCR
jgi:hypothetical protein